MIGVFGARLDNGGLGWQTNNIVRMLKPDKILAIDSSSFNRGSVQDYSRYDGFDPWVISHWPTNRDCNLFTRSGVKHIFMCETPYNLALYGYARVNNVKTYCQINYEFLDAIHNKAVPHPDFYIIPSCWKLEEMHEQFGDKVVYMPPPTFPNDFKRARTENFSRKGSRKFLHIMGKVSSKDRNGTFDLLDAVKASKEDFELVIRCQHEIPEYIEYVNDRRITWDIRNVPDQNDMYQGFDAMILPRRYGGLCLPMNEALMSGLPVIMPDISPNNKVLPQEWLVEARASDQLMTRALLDVYSSDISILSNKIDWLATIEEKQLSQMKIHAFEIGYENYSPEILKNKYKELMQC